MLSEYNLPEGIDFDMANDLLIIADTFNNLIRAISVPESSNNSYFYYFFNKK